MYDDFDGDGGDFYDGDDLEAFGQQDSFEHVMGERYADGDFDESELEDDEDFEDDEDEPSFCTKCGTQLVVYSQSYREYYGARVWNDYSLRCPKGC